MGDKVLFFPQKVNKGDHFLLRITKNMGGQGNLLYFWDPNKTFSRFLFVRLARSLKLLTPVLSYLIP